jgi:hypothetical protein
VSESGGTERTPQRTPSRGTWVKHVSAFTSRNGPSGPVARRLAARPRATALPRRRTTTSESRPDAGPRQHPVRLAAALGGCTTRVRGNAG